MSKVEAIDASTESIIGIPSALQRMDSFQYNAMKPMSPLRQLSMIAKIMRYTANRPSEMHKLIESIQLVHFTIDFSRFACLYLLLNHEGQDGNCIEPN